MKKICFFLSLYCCVFIGEHVNAAANTTDSTSRSPQTYFLTEPNRPAAQTQPAVTSTTTSDTTPLVPAKIEERPVFNPRSYNTPSSTERFGRPAYPSPTTNTYANPSSYLQNNLQTQQLAWGNAGQNSTTANYQNERWQSYPGYRYTGQSSDASDSCCAEQQPEDSPCGDNFGLYCHYRPCYYYTTECEYIPKYEYHRCCRYIPQYYKETRCKQIPEYYQIMRCKMEKEPYCITRCRIVEKYNEETGCCDTYPEYYSETCYRDVPVHYEETACRQVPQYYEETCCRYVPQYYYTCVCKYCPQYKNKRQCKYVPQYYYKQESCCKQAGMQFSECCSTP